MVGSWKEGYSNVPILNWKGRNDNENNNDNNERNENKMKEKDLIAINTNNDIGVLNTANFNNQNIELSHNMSTNTNQYSMTHQTLSVLGKRKLESTDTGLFVWVSQCVMRIFFCLCVCMYACLEREAKRTKIETKRMLPPPKESPYIWKMYPMLTFEQMMERVDTWVIPKKGYFTIFIAFCFVLCVV